MRNLSDRPVRTSPMLYSRGRDVIRPAGPAVLALLFAGLFTIGLADEAQAQLARRAIVVDLGSGIAPGPLPFDEPFFLTSPASESLLQVRLWFEEDPTLRQEQCSKLQPPTRRQENGTRDTSADARSSEEPLPVIPEDQYSSWTRTGADSATSFVLQAGPLLPNTDYTFCFHLIRRPTDKDAAEFTTNAVAGLTREVRKLASGALVGPAAIDAFQAALIAALPRVDSIDYRDTASIFLKPLNETPEQKNVRLNRIVLASVRFRQSIVNRRDNLIILEEDVGDVVSALQSLVSDSALLRLQGVAVAAAPTKADQQRFANAAILASQIARFGATEIDRVARGIHPIDGPVQDQGSRDTTGVWESAALQPYLTNLERSREMLRDLYDLVLTVRDRQDLMARAGLTATALDAAATRIERSIRALGGQTHYLSLIGTSLNEIRTSIADLAGSVSTIDFVRVALRSTTSGTYVARANTYISLDAGLVGARQLRQVVPYFGVNLYFRPVNKNAPLSQCEEDCFLRRFSLTFGLTATSVKEEGRVEDLFANRAALLGAGYRFTDYWRWHVGVLVVRSPLDEQRRRFRMNPLFAVGTAIDIDVVGLLGKAGTVLFP